MSKINAMLLISFLSLSGCNNLPSKQVTQCAPLFEYNEDGTINLEESVCACRQYKLSKETIGPIGQEEDLPIESCDALVGFPPEDYVEVLDFAERARSACNKN